MKPQGTQLSLFETRSSSDPFAVRVSPRARRLTARVHVGGRVEIVVPIGVRHDNSDNLESHFARGLSNKIIKIVISDPNLEANLSTLTL